MPKEQEKKGKRRKKATNIFSPLTQLATKVFKDKTQAVAVLFICVCFGVSIPIIALKIPKDKSPVVMISIIELLEGILSNSFLYILLFLSFLALIYFSRREKK